MAKVCPQCQQIHFETTTEPMPTKCRRCEADLSGMAGVIPVIHDDANDGRSLIAPKVGVAQFLIGGTLLMICAGLVWFGLKSYNEAVEVTATVLKYNKGMGGQEGVRRLENIAVINVDGRKVYTYPGVRIENDVFKAYYPPGQPEKAGESRPFLMLVGAAGCGLIGASMFVMGVFRFVLAQAQHRDYNRSLRTTRL